MKLVEAASIGEALRAVSVAEPVVRVATCECGASMETGYVVTPGALWVATSTHFNPRLFGMTPIRSVDDLEASADAFNDMRVPIQELRSALAQCLATVQA